MTTTQFGYCPRCDDRKELVMNSAGAYECHSCGSLDVYENRREYEKSMEE